MHRLLDAPPGEPAYVMQYSCRSLDAYHRYRDDFAPALQKITLIASLENSAERASCWKKLRDPTRR